MHSVEHYLLLLSTTNLHLQTATTQATTSTMMIATPTTAAIAMITMKVVRSDSAETHCIVCFTAIARTAPNVRE